MYAGKLKGQEPPWNITLSRLSEISLTAVGKVPAL